MFASTLRKRSLWADLGPQLLVQKFAEHDTDDHDIAVQIQPCKRLSVLVISSYELESQFNRLDRWAENTTPDTKLIALIAGADHIDGDVALAKLQIHDLEMNHSTPTIVIPGSTHVLHYLNIYIQELGRPLVAETSNGVNRRDLIALATSTAPGGCLNQSEADIVYRLAGSMKNLEIMVHSKEGQERLSRHLSPITIQNLVQFWEDEWIV